MAKSASRSATAAEANVLQINQEALETVLELQMSFLETASRFAQEFTAFAAHRVEANAEDFARLTDVKSPPELLQLQLEHMRTMFEDYMREANKLMAMTSSLVRESGEAVRASCLPAEAHRKPH
ncbi:phasin protein [Tepidamorphus gemmatus]|uniref:Phasin protein n=1 Tax=Tepidamorphus gemmatus TaxID=747076 RepID=A0A4R3MEU3_9HYPH|nr:phasin family protein [Tepidamorphus gemmatus]TCT12021.1 phasin protein [Tepidamorphus gemmatus]